MAIEMQSQPRLALRKRTRAIQNVEKVEIAMIQNRMRRLSIR
jgi:hypothetical protein